MGMSGVLWEKLVPLEYVEWKGRGERSSNRCSDDDVLAGAGRSGPVEPAVVVVVVVVVMVVVVAAPVRLARELRAARVRLVRDRRRGRRVHRERIRRCRARLGAERLCIPRAWGYRMPPNSEFVKVQSHF